MEGLSAAFGAVSHYYHSGSSEKNPPNGQNIALPTNCESNMYEKMSAAHGLNAPFDNAFT